MTWRRCAVLAPQSSAATDSALVGRFALTGERTTIDITTLPAGLYLLRVGGLATTVVVRR